jgi:hypothetical protein
MRWPPLHETLVALVESVSQEPNSLLRVERADLRVPLEVKATFGPEGPAVLARVPHTRWIAGFQIPTSMSQLSITCEVDGLDTIMQAAEVA